MKKLLALLLSVIMVFALVACAQTDDGDVEGPDTEEAKYGGHLNLMADMSIGSLDPGETAGVFYVQNLVWEAPLSRNADGSIAPGVCDFELSDDYLTLKLWVIEGKTFHDGSAVEIEDVVASIQRRGHKTPSQYLVDYIESVSIKDGVATVKFKSYNAKTMQQIAPNARIFVAVLPKEFCEKYPGNAAATPTLNSNLEDAIGTGPYKFVDWRQGEWFKLERYEGYKKSDASLTGYAAPKNAYLDSITFYESSDETATIISLLAHDIDVTTVAMGEYNSQLEINNLAQTLTLGSKTKFIEFNTVCQENVVHDDPNLRKAICAAIDWEEINDNFWDGLADFSGTPCVDSIYYVDTFEKVDYMGAANPELAKKYLAKSHYAGEVMTLYAFDANLFALLDSYLKPLGINIAYHAGSAPFNLNDGKQNWDFIFRNYSTGESPSSMSATVFTRAWNSEAKEAVRARVNAAIPGSAECLTAWKELCNIWVEEASVPYIGQTKMAWTHDKDLVCGYEGIDAYLWNWYWKNPSEHTAK